MLLYDATTDNLEKKVKAIGRALFIRACVTSQPLPWLAGPRLCVAYRIMLGRNSTLFQELRQ